MDCLRVSEAHIAVVHYCLVDLGLAGDDTAALFNDLFAADIRAAGRPLFTQIDIERLHENYEAPTLFIQRGGFYKYLLPIREAAGRMRIDVPAYPGHMAGSHPRRIGGGTAARNSKAAEGQSMKRPGGKEGSSKTSAGIDGAEDEEQDETSRSDDGTAKMLMIHVGHMAVDWEDGCPSVNAPLPSNDAEILGNDVFVPFDSPLYLHGGKTFRASFIWITEDGEEEVEDRDVMLCRAGECPNVCGSGVRLPTALESTNGTPLVHSSCIDRGAQQGVHAFDIFKPMGDLKNDHPRAYPQVEKQQVGFNDGLRDAFVCIPATCVSCSAVAAGTKPPRESLLDGEKRMQVIQSRYAARG